jgi:hypothetical protein
MTSGVGSTCRLRHEGGLVTGFGQLRITLSGREAESDLRRLTAAIPLRGSVTLAYEREPDFYHALEVEGDHVDVATVHDGERVAGFATQSMSMRHVNGVPNLVSYLGMARVEPHLRARQVTPEALRMFREVQLSRGVRHAFASIVATRSGRHAFPDTPTDGMPGLQAMADLCTLVFPVIGRHYQDLPDGIRPAREEDTGQLIACLNRNNRPYQFSEVWNETDLHSESRTRGLKIEDFLVATKAGHVMGCVALWDQRAFKQTRVIDYSGPLSMARPFVNVFCGPMGKPKMPARGQLFEQVFVSHLAVDEDDRELTLDLLNSIRIEAARRGGIFNLALGMSADDPRLESVRRVTRGLLYSSTLYRVFWPDMEPLAQLEGRARAEIALL